MKDPELEPGPVPDSASHVTPRESPAADDELEQTARSRVPPLLRADLAAGPNSAPTGVLVVIAHPRTVLLGHRYELALDATLVVGRAPDNDLSFADVSEISRHHARCRRAAGRAVVEDLGSHNGTYLNGVAVRESTPLASGDVIQVGPVLLEYFEGASVERLFYAAMYQRAVRDELTGAFSRPRLEEELGRCLALARRHRRPSSLMLIDVDEFERVNDAHGHPYGDRVLQRLVEVIAPLLRRESMFARIGGDEFALLCPETPLPGAEIFAERLRQVIAGHRFDHDGASTSITCSFGLAELGGDAPDPGAVYRLAERALSRAKRDGGDRVAVSRPDATAP